MPGMPSPEETEPCPNCNGVGTVYLGQPQRCPECGGTGEVTVEDEEELESIEAQLAKQGLRHAKNGEAGWYVMVTDRDADGTYGTKVWATDLPEKEVEHDVNEMHGAHSPVCVNCGHGINAHYGHPNPDQERVCRVCGCDQPFAGSKPEPAREGFTFDKFMDVTLISEARTHGTTKVAASPQRQLARSYQENPLGRIRMGGKR